MAWVHGEIVIGRPVTEVFDYVAGQGSQPGCNPRAARAEKVTAGPAGKGARFRSVAAAGGRAVPLQIECTGCKRPRLLTTKTTTPRADIACVLRFDPAAAGTRVRWSARVRPKGTLRLLGPAVAWLGNRHEQQTWTSTKEYLEASR